MPAKWTAETLPAPGRAIFINDIPPRTIAAIRFSGRADAILLADQETALRRWCADRNLNLMGDAEYAFYNSTLIPVPLRRNEVLIEEIGRANVCTPVPNAHLVCRLLLAKDKQRAHYNKLKTYTHYTALTNHNS